MAHQFLPTLKRIVTNPYLNIAVGLIFLCSGIFETVRELEELDGDFKVGAHHGIILFSLLHILKTIPDMFEGLEYLEKGGAENTGYAREE